jgi:hypothetical protein
MATQEEINYITSQIKVNNYLLFSVLVCTGPFWKKAFFGVKDGYATGEAISNTKIYISLEEILTLIKFGVIKLTL